MISTRLRVQSDDNRPDGASPWCLSTLISQNPSYHWQKIARKGIAILLRNNKKQGNTINPGDMIQLITDQHCEKLVLSVPVGFVTSNEEL